MMPYVYINQHAHDIAFAVFRVAALVRHPKLKGELESAAVDLIAKMDVYVIHEEDIYANHKPFYHHERLKWLVRLSESVGEIKPINAAVLCREIDNLEAAIVESMSNIEEGDIDLDNEDFVALEEVLEKRLIKSPSQKNEEDSMKAVISDTVGAIQNNIIEDVNQQQEKEVIVQQQETKQSKKKNIQVFLTPDERQEKMIKVIRQMPNGCRMRDLMALFPKVSERTLRNDLQMLVKQGVIERFGSQGPYSYFRAVTKSEVFAL